MIFLAILLFVFCILMAISLFFALKYAPYVPTNIATAELMLKEAKLKKGDKIYDLGCGDGRLVHLAVEKYGANAAGFEIDPLTYLIARFKKFLYNGKGKIHKKNFLQQDITDAKVITCYLLPKVFEQNKDYFHKLHKSGVRIISHGFQIPELTAKKTIPRNKQHGTVYVY